MASSEQRVQSNPVGSRCGPPPAGLGMWQRLGPELSGATVDALSSHVALIDSDGVVVAVNRAWSRFGAQNGAQSEGVSIGVNYLAVCDSASGPVSEEARRTGEGLRRLLSGSIEEFRQQYRCETASGIRWYQMRASRFSHDGRVYAVVAHEDITEVMRAHEALAESESRFLQITSVIDQVFWMTSPKPERVVYVNPAFERLWGARCEDLYRDPRLWTARIHPEDRARVEATYGRWIRSGGAGAWDEQYRLLRPDGSVRWIHDRAHAVPPAPDGTPSGLVCGLAEDVTELRTYRDHLEHLVDERTRQLKESNELLAQQDRLASVGTLAAGLGHDLANVLFPMRCRLDVLESGDLPDSLRPEVEGLRATIEYLQRLSASLRLCAMDPLDPGEVGPGTDLAEWAPAARPIIDKSVPEGIEQRWEIPGGLPRVTLAPHQLTQAVLNLVGNSAESIPEAGSITVRARAVGAARSFVELTVSDTGSGMTDETRRHALHPFFTTKRRGRSTGLGLTLVHSIVKSAGGEVRIQSAPHEGTAVTLRLPAAGAKQVTHAPRDADRGVPGTVALSLNDPRRAALARHVAASLGFTVREGAPRPPTDADIWITEPAPTVGADAGAFLSQGNRRAAVLFGADPGDAQKIGAEPVRDGAGLDELKDALLRAQRRRLQT